MRGKNDTSAWVESVIAPVDILEQKVVGQEEPMMVLQDLKYTHPEEEVSMPTGLLQSLEYTDPEGRFARPTECSCESPVIESGIRITNGGLEHVDLCNTCELEVIGHE